MTTAAPSARSPENTGPMHAAQDRQDDLTPRGAPALFSMVIPVFNEEDALPYLRQALEDWRRSLPFPSEVILVNDGSTDGSMRILRQWASSDTSVKVLSFSRNFGHQIAVSAGLEWCRGDAVAILDADLQDPLAVVSDMIREYQAGYDVVYGIRSERLGESLFKRVTAWAFYRLMRLLVSQRLPADTGDFRVVSRRCVTILCAMPEGHRFLRGLFSWVGFPHKGVPYVRQPRRHGSTKYPFLKMLRFAANAVVSFSPLPVRLIGVFGALVALLGFAYGAYVVCRWYFIGDTVRGWPTIIILLAIIGGMILLSLGIVGEYVSRIYEAVKQRPLYVIQDAVNIEKGAPDAR